MILSSVSSSGKNFFLLLAFALVTFTPPTTAKAEGPSIAASVIEDDPRFNDIAVAAWEEIIVGNIPGAVVLVGHRGRVVYRQAFGD